MPIQNKVDTTMPFIYYARRITENTILQGPYKIILSTDLGTLQRFRNLFKLIFCSSAHRATVSFKSHTIDQDKCIVPYV